MSAQPKNQYCGNCRFFINYFPKLTRLQKEYGQCRLNPPQMVYGGEEGPDYAKFPEVDEYNWCGKWALNEKAKS